MPIERLPNIAAKYLVLPGDAASRCVLVGLKLIGQSLATWGLGAEESFVVVHLAALPTSMGFFMLVELYEREALLMARVVLKATLVSVITLSLLLMLR